jgi:hypothetical protein
MKIAKHFVGAPATDKANDVGIDTSAQEGHSTPGTKATGGDVPGVDAEGEVEGGSTEAEHSGDASGGDRSGGGGRRKKTKVERSRRGGAVQTEVYDTTYESKHRAGRRMARTGMANLFPPNGVLLVGED